MHRLFINIKSYTMHNQFSTQVLHISLTSGRPWISLPDQFEAVPHVLMVPTTSSENLAVSRLRPGRLVRYEYVRYL